MNSKAREKIFKSWKGVNEVALIKEVATKGEHIELCIEFCAGKRKMDIKDYRLFFYDVVQNYVQRLLTERLVCKAENVLRNVQRDICCCYYQFACECNDEELRDIVLEHIRRNDTQGTGLSDEDMQQLHFNWEILLQIKEQAELLAKCKEHMPERRIDLEAMVSMDSNFRRRILVELFFKNRNSGLLPHLHRTSVWEYLVDTEDYEQLIRWMICAAKNSRAESATELEKYYIFWSPLDAEMYEYALKSLKNPNEVLRDCFAIAGYFFADERDDVIKTLQRICTTGSFDVNREIIEMLPLAEYLFDRGYYMILLRSFVSVRKLEELAERHEDQRKLIELIIALKTYDLETREGFEKVFFATKFYLEDVEEKRRDGPDQVHTMEDPFVAVFEWLCNAPTVDSLKCFLHSSVAQRMPYMVALKKRMELYSNIEAFQKTIPTAYDLFRKFRNVDMKRIKRENNHEIPSFSNERLCKLYGRKYELNFMHYLKQKRAAYAVYYFLITQLQNFAQITPQQIFSACENAMELALKTADDELVAHCVAFNEILGYDTQPMRILLKLRRLLMADADAIDDEEGRRSSSLCITNVGNLIKDVEKKLFKQICDKDQDQNQQEQETMNPFPFHDYQALMRLASYQKTPQWPTLILEYYAKRDDWWRLLILCHFFQVPLDIIRRLVLSFKTRQIGEHFYRALSYEAPPISIYERRQSGGGGGGGGNKRQSNARHKKTTIDAQARMTASFETMASSMSSCNEPCVANPSSSSSVSTPIKPSLEQIQQLQLLNYVNGNESRIHDNSNIDLVALILLSTTSVPEQTVDCLSKFLELMRNTKRDRNATSWNLTQNAVKYRLPVLAVLAATVNDANFNWYWLVYLAVATKQWTWMDDLLKFAANAVKDRQSNLALRVIETALREGHVITITRSISVFYGQDNPLSNLFRFLCLTQHEEEFEDKAIHELRLYLLAWSNDEVHLPLVKLDQTSSSSNQSQSREEILQRTIHLLFIHLEHNFNSILEQQQFLACICRSGMTDLCGGSGGQVDFCLLNEIFIILKSLKPKDRHQLMFTFDFQRILQKHESHKEYKRLLDAFLEAHFYDRAIQLANLIHMPICDIVYAKWIASLNSITQADDDDECCDLIDFASYEAEVVEHALPPEILVNFFLHTVSLLDEQGTGTGTTTMLAVRKKYILLYNALNVIKKHLLFPNESFDRDQIEYNMIIYYLQLDELESSKLNIYHSEYYEQIMQQERCVLYKSFLELKQLAGIDDLNNDIIKTTITDVMQQRLEALLHRLLDESDIVEALRLQELCECRPLDLRFIVFCMALAEGVTTVFSMSSEERQLLCDIEKSAFAKFNKRTLDTLRDMGSHHQTYQNSYSSSPTRDDLSDSCSMLEFEEIPSKEKRETLETIQGIASKLKHGIDIGKRIVMAYRAAMYLDKEYLDVLRTKDSNILLRSVAEESCLHRLMVVSDILISTHMTEDEIADLLAYEITTAIVRPRFYIFNSGQNVQSSLKNADIWGYNIDKDLHLFLELTPNTTKLGNCLLKYCDALKAYRKYQDDKPFESTIFFEKLAEIIRIYGLPTTESMPTNSVATSSGATTMPVVMQTSTTLSTTLSNVGASVVGGVATTVSSLMSAGATHINTVNNSSTTNQHPHQVLSHKKQNLIYVELLIKAHQCFVHECSMEGIADVLYRAKVLNTILAQSKSWSLIVRLLTGIGRYREMFYCFDTLIENEQFESLLGQFEKDKTIGLRQAILAYLREYGPKNSRELFKLAAVHFLMYKDLAEMWEQDAQAILAKIQNIASVANNLSSNNAASNTNDQASIKRLRYTPEIPNLLQEALDNYTHAAENYLLDDKLLLAVKSASMCEVIAMQIDLVSRKSGTAQNASGGGGGGGSNNSSSTSSGAASTTYQQNCICVLNVQTREEFRELVNSELSVPQALILSRGYGYDISWSEALLSQYVLLLRKNYLNEFLQLVTINDGIIENVCKGYLRQMQNHNKIVPQMEEHLEVLVKLVRSVTLKYKLASLLSMKQLVLSLINDQTVYYLKDTDYGRNEHHNMPDI